jgi:hypothetical protein
MRAGGSRVALLAAASVVLSGCGIFLGGTVTGGLSSSSCTEMTGSACGEQVERIAARHPGATQVDLTCTVPVCDRKGGSGTAVVTMGNGARLNDTFSYVGDPAPLPLPTCTGLPADVCRSLAESQAADAPTMKRIAAIEVRCTAAACTTDKGEADVKVTLADGSTMGGGTSWEGGLP